MHPEPQLKKVFKEIFWRFNKFEITKKSSIIITCFCISENKPSLVAQTYFLCQSERVSSKISIERQDDKLVLLTVNYSNFLFVNSKCISR